MDRKILAHSEQTLTKKELLEILSDVPDDAPIRVRVDELRGGARSVFLEDDAVVISD